MIVFPMMGRSSRFRDAGYTVPKYELLIGDAPVLDYVLTGFRGSFKSETFVFVCRRDTGARGCIESASQRLGVRSVLVLEFEGDTKGQAETVEVALRRLAVLQADLLREPLWIFNIDTIRRDPLLPLLAPEMSGWVEVAQLAGEHWSFIHLDDKGRMTRLTEKSEPTGLASTGLYYWANGEVYLKCFSTHYGMGLPGDVNEMYVAPMYNTMLARGDLIGWNLIDAESLIFCGVPSEYLGCLARSHELAQWLRAG
jgi:hypothetical protein